MRNHGAAMCASQAKVTVQQRVIDELSHRRRQPETPENALLARSSLPRQLTSFAATGEWVPISREAFTREAPVVVRCGALQNSALRSSTISPKRNSLSRRK